MIGSSRDAEILEQKLQEAQGKAQDPQTMIGSPRDAEIWENRAGYTKCNRSMLKERRSSSTSSDESEGEI